MNRKDLRLFLVLELVALVWPSVASLFARQFPYEIAILISKAFVALAGVWMFGRAARWGDRVQSWTAYPLTAIVVAVSLPWLVALGSTLVQPDLLTFLMAGQENEFYRWLKFSDGLFMALIAATIADFFRAEDVAEVPVVAPPAL